MRHTDATDDRELTYWRHRTPVGVKVEEISGGSSYSGRVWELMVRQVWNENGRDGEYRNVSHTSVGVPLIEGGNERISISHTAGMMVVATLPPTPEVDLTVFTPRAAMGVDTERTDRSVPDNVRDRVFSADEIAMMGSDPEKTILAWTCKEALYKAVQGQAASWADDYRILQLPDPETETQGVARVMLPSSIEECILYAYRSGNHFITLALSTRCATFRKAVG